MADDRDTPAEVRDRRFQVAQFCQRAIRVLREAEDWALIEEYDPVLAARFRESYECITERVINGKYGHGLSRDMWAWDELPQRAYCDPSIDEGRHHIGPHKVYRRVREDENG